MQSRKTHQHYWQLIFVKVAANLKSESSRNYLSYLWWVIDPTLHMLTLYLVFGVLLQRGTPNFPAFLMIGIIPWLWFNKSVNHGMMSIVQGKGLMMQVHLPKIILPTITILQDAVKQMVIIVLLLLFLILYGLDPSIHWLAMPMIITTQFVLIAACTYLVATIIPFLPDLNFLIQAGLQMLMFCSGVFYSLEMVPDQYRSIVYSINPMANLLRNYRYVLLYNQWPDWYALLFISAGSLALIVVMWLVIRKLDHVFPRVVL